MRYATVYPSTARQARSRRIGRCARCHAPVLADEEHYEFGGAVVHGACGAEAVDPAGESRPGTPASSRPATQLARRARRGADSGLIPPLPIGKV